MTTTSWTTSDVTALETAIRSGVRRVSYATGSVEYHSLGEMLTLLDRMRAEVGGSSESQVIYAGRIR